MCNNNICEKCKFGYGGYGWCKLKDENVLPRKKCGDFIKSNIREIGDIGNYYGGLEVKEDEGKFYWCIENWDGHHWNEIPEDLYRSLMAYEDSRD